MNGSFARWCWQSGGVCRLQRQAREVARVAKSGAGAHFFPIEPSGKVKNFQPRPIASRIPTDNHNPLQAVLNSADVDCDIVRQRFRLRKSADRKLLQLSAQDARSIDRKQSPLHAARSYCMYSSQKQRQIASLRAARAKGSVRIWHACRLATADSSSMSSFPDLRLIASCSLSG